MRLIFEPSSVRLYIKPFWSKMKPTTGLRTLLVSICPPAPTVMIATEPSTPTFQPSVRWKLANADVGHEQDDDGARLGTELKSDRGRNDVVEAGGAAADVQCALAIFAADADAGFDDGRKHQDRRRLVGQFPSGIDLIEEVFQRYANVGVDLGTRGRLGARR